MWNLITGRSSEKSEAPSPEGRRRKDYDQRSTQRPSVSIISSKSARNPSRGDDRDRGFNPTSTSYSSSSRSPYPGTASASIASSYATANSGQPDEPVLPPGLVRNASLANQIPKSRSSRDERDQDRDRERQSERRRDRSSSRDRKRDRDGKKRERRDKREKGDRGDGKDRGLARPGSGYAEELDTSRTGEVPGQTSGSFSAQVQNSGFTQFPGQYDGEMPGFTSGPPPLPESMSAHVQDQFPGQFPMESAAPYRPPLAASEGGPGLAAEYYGDAGESVAEQPGVRPHPPALIVGAEPHLLAASPTTAPPPEPSSAGGVGAAASFYNGENFQPTQPSQPFIPVKPSRPGKTSRPSMSGSFSGSAALAGSAVLGYTAGITGETIFTQENGSNSTAYYQHEPGRPPLSTTGYSPTSAPMYNGYHASSAPILPTLGAAAAGAAAGYMMGGHSSGQQQPSAVSDHSEYSSPATQRPPSQPGGPAIGISNSSRPPRPAKHSSQFSNIPVYAAGQFTPMAQRHRHSNGPLGTFVEFWTDPDGVAQYEEYTEYIGVCRNCFAPGSSPRDAPREHHYRRRGSNERYGSSTRVDKESRWGSSDGENRRRSRKSWLATGIAGYGLAEVGKTLFNQKRDFDDTYSVRSGRVNASNSSLLRRKGSYSPRRGSRTSYGVTGGSSSSKTRRRSRSQERVETGVTSDGKIYKKATHGSLVGGPNMITYSPRRRSRSRSGSRSRDRHNGLAGAALGSSVMASISRRRSPSPKKSFVRSEYRSREHSPGRGESSVLGGLFGSPSEMGQRSHTKKEEKKKKKKKKKGFFSFGNSSSSSADADLAFGAGLEGSRDRKKRSTRSRNDRNADAALLGLSAAAAAIAVGESQKGSKASRRANLVAVKESKSRNSPSSERHHRERRTSASPTMEEDLWESASEEDDSSSANSALAYGGPARKNQESLPSDSSGTGKWGWRWGSKKKLKRTAQANSSSNIFHIPAGTAAATLAGATAGAAVASDVWPNDSRMSSSSNLPPLQQVYPVPTSDPSRFDVTRHDSIASSNRPIVTSRPAPVPLQQPQPRAPVSNTVYTTQAPYGHSYSAPGGPPSGPPMFTQISYQTQPSMVGPPRDTFNGSTQTNLPGSFPGGDIVSENALRNGRKEFTRSQRDTSPILRTAESEMNSIPRRRRASTRDETSAVRFDLSEEPTGEDLRDRLPHKRGVDQKREEVKFQDADDQRQFDNERRTSHEIPSRSTESTSGPEEKLDRKRETRRQRRDDESKDKKKGQWVVPVAAGAMGAAIGASALEAADFAAETRQDKRREESPRDRVEDGEGRASDEPKYPSQRRTGRQDSGEQQVQIAQQVSSKIVKSPSHENYAAYFTPPELLSKSNYDSPGIDVNGDNNVTSYQIPQIITVEPKGPRPSFPPAYAFPDEVDLDHMTLPWQVPRLNLIQPTPPHSIAGSTKGDASPIITPEDSRVEETEETPKSATTPRVTWGEDETHTYQVITPLDNPEEFIGPSTKLRNGEEDVHLPSEASPLDTTPIIVERAPRHVPGDFGDDLEFAATVAAGLEDTGFNPAIVIDDPNFRRRDSPPWSEQTGFYRRPFAETVTDLGLESPGTEGAPPQQGFVEGELPPTPKYQQGPSANGNPVDDSASKLSKKGKERREKIQQRQSEDDVPTSVSSVSVLDYEGGMFHEPGKYSTEPEPMVSIPVNVNDYLDEGPSVEETKGENPKKDVGEPESASSGSPVQTDPARSEYFDAPEAAAQASKPSNTSREVDQVMVDVPSSEQAVDDFQDSNRAYKEEKKSKKSQRDGLIYEFPAKTPGSLALERTSEVSSKRKADRKSSRRDSERYELPSGGSSSVVSEPVSEEYGERKQSRSRGSTGDRDLYGATPENPRSISVPIEDRFEEPRKSKKKSKRGSSGYDDVPTSMSLPATLEDKRDSKSKFRKDKKAGPLGLFGASKSSDKLSESGQAKDTVAEATSDVFEEPKRKSRKSNERRSTRDGDDVSSQVSDNTTERLPETALAGDLDADVTSDDFDDPKEKRKKSKGRKSTSTRDGDDVYSQVSQGTSDLSRLESDNDDGKSRRKERRRRSQESDIVEASGRITQDLQAKVYKAASPGRYTAFMMSQALIIPEARDSTSTREGPIIDRSDVVNATGVSGKDEPMSFLGERQEIPPPPDINIPTDPQILHAETTVENPRSSTVQPESEVGRISGNHEARITSPLAVFPLEDLPPLPGSRPTSPVPEVEGRRRRLSVVQTSESSQSPAATPSSTAIPLYFRRPPQSPGFARSSPLASPATPAQKAAIFVSPQRRSRPNSTEFKSSTEFRPLWLVERHRSRQEPAPEESYPSLPSSHSTSRSSSVHDPEEIDMYRNGDYGLIGSQEGSDGEALGVTIDTILEFEQSELLGSRQATPTATSFHADVHENALAEAAQRSGPAERSQSHQDNARDAVHGVSPSSPQRLPHSGGDLFPGRRAVSPSRYSPEDVEDLPPLPASRSSSPLQKASRLGSSAVLEVAEPMEDLPPLPASRSSSPLQKASRLGSSAVLEVAEPLEDLPPLPASRSSSPLREDQRRGTSPLLKGAVMGAFVGVAAAAAALGTAHHDKVSARDDLREAKADSLDVLEVPTEIVRDEASTTSTAENIDEPEMLLTEASKKKVKHNQKGSRSMREHDPPVQVESGPPSAINQDIGASTTDDERDLQEQDIREPVDTLFIPSMLKKTKKGKKGKKKGRGNESSNAEADSLGSSSIEASSLRKSRAVSPSGVVAVSGGPTISEPGLMAALQSTEAGEDDWPGFLAGSKKLKGKKSKKKFARSWQEEPIEPGVTGGDVGLEHHPESLGSQASTTDYEEKNTCHPPLSDVDVGPTDVVRHLTRKVTLELVPNAEESERLGGTNQEGRETEEHLVVKEELVSERSPILQQPLDTAGQAPQFPSNKSFWARDLPEIRDEDTATSTPQKDADEHFIVPIKAAKKGKKKGKTLQLDHYVEPSAPPTKYVDTSVEQIEAFAPNDAEQPRNILGSNGEGITQSTQEQEPQLETEFTVPFKASNKGKKKRKTLPVDDYLESSTPLAEAEEILTKRDIHEDGQAGETDGLVGGTTTTSHNTFERVLEPSAGIEKSFAGGYQVRAPPPTFQGPDALDLTSEAVPLPMTKDLDLLEALPASPAAQHLSAEAIPLPTDEDLDLLEALPASPILEPSDITSRESEHAHEYVSRLETDKDPALTLLPSAPADGSDHMMLDQAPETLTPEKDDIQDQIAVPKLLPELGDVQRDAPSVLARVAGDTHDDAPPSVKRASDPDRSLTQETADDFFASVSKGKGKNGKKDYQSLSISPDLGPASTESDFPAGPVTTEKDSTLPSRTIGTEITQEQSNEGDWDIPSKKKKKKKKSKKGDKEKSASIAAGYASQEADSPPDLPNPGSDPVYDAQEADIIKDLTDSPELRKDLSLPEPEEEAAFAWEPTQKKSKKGKTSKTQIQQSLTENRSSAGGERPDIPAAAEKPFATTDTAHAVREMLIDRGSTPGLEPASHEVNVVGPVSNDYVPKHEAIYLEISSQVEEDPSREVTNEEGSTERQEAGVPSTRTPTLDNLLAPEGKLASTNTAREVQSMLANQDSPQLSDEFSREDSGVPTLVTQALTEQSLEDDEPWNNPVKKIGKKAKKGRTVQGPVLITDESSKIPTPPVEPETTPLNDEGVTEAPENFTSKKSKKFKKEKRGKKKASWQSVSDFAGEVARELVPLAETVGLPVQESAIPPTKNNIIEPVEQDAESSRNILERAATTELPTLSTSQGSQLRPFHRVEEPKLNKDPDTKTAKQQSYFDQAIRPTEIQELPLSPQPHSDELLDYAASLPLPLDKVEDSPVDVPVQDGEESEAAWSRAVDSAGAENIQIESPRSQQFPQSSLDEHLTADQSGESSVLKVSSPMAIETTLVVENTREPVVGGEDDVEGFTTKKTGKKDKRQQRKLLERQETDNAEVPISHQSEVPGTEDRLGSSVPVDEPAFDIPFSPEMGDASRDALRELELEDGVSYFGLTAADSGTEIRRRGDDHQTTLANEEDWRPVHKDHPMTGRVRHSLSAAPHERALATIIEQPDPLGAVSFDHEFDSQLPDEDFPIQGDSSQPFESIKKEIKNYTKATRLGTNSQSSEQFESQSSPMDDSPGRQGNAPLTTDLSVVHPSDDSLPIVEPASDSFPRLAANEDVPLSPIDDFPTFAASRKGNKSKKSRKKQEPVIWEDDTATPAATDNLEPTVDHSEAPRSPITFDSPASITPGKNTGDFAEEQPERWSSTEPMSSAPRAYTTPEEQPAVGDAGDNWEDSTKRTSKQGKKMKRLPDFAQNIEGPSRLEYIVEPNMLATQDTKSWAEQQGLDRFDMPSERNAQYIAQSSSLTQDYNSSIATSGGQSSSVPLVGSFERTPGMVQVSDGPQESTPRANTDELLGGQQPEHEYTAVNVDHPQELRTVKEEQHDDVWDFPITKKSKKSKKSQKQSLRLDVDTTPPDEQPEPNAKEPEQDTSTKQPRRKGTDLGAAQEHTTSQESLLSRTSENQQLPNARNKEHTSITPSQVVEHHGDGQLAGVAAIATLGASVEENLWRNDSMEKGEKSPEQRKNRQWAGHEDEGVEFPSFHSEEAEPSEDTWQLEKAAQQKLPAQSQPYHDSPPHSPKLPGEGECTQDTMLPPVSIFHFEDDAKRDSAVQISDSPLISERLPTYDGVRDSGYQGTESSPPVGIDRKVRDTSGAKRHAEIVERPPSQASYEDIGIPEQIHSYENTALYNADNPLNISVEVDPAYEVSISRHDSRRGRGRARSNSQESNLDKEISPRTDIRPARHVESPVQSFDEPPQPSPVDSTTKDRSSVLFQSSPSTREERADQSSEYEARHVSRGTIDHVDLSPTYKDSSKNVSGPEMSPRAEANDGSSILAARASSLAALSGLTDTHQGSPRSLFGGPVGVKSDVPSMISPPRTPFSLEHSGRRRLNTITEHSPEESPLHKKVRAISSIGSPEPGTKSARRSATPRETSQQRVRSPTIAGTGDDSLISTDDLLARLSWPPVDEDKHSVGLERSRSRNTDGQPSSRHSSVLALNLISDAVKQREAEYRSVSGASVHSGESINAIIRTPEQFRSASGLSNRSGTPPLRRVDTRSVSGDLRAASKRSEAGNLAKAPAGAEAAPAPADPHALAIPSSSTYDPVKDKGKSRVKDMADVFEGWGDVHNNGSPLSPTRPPSMRRRQSMQILDLETRLDQLASENRLLQDAKSRAERSLEDAHHDRGQESSAMAAALETRDAYLRQKDSELSELRRMLEGLQSEVTRLTEVNQSLATTRGADADYEHRYSQLQAEHDNTHARWQQSTRQLEDLRQQHLQLSTGMEGIVRHEVSIALEEKNAELAILREELGGAKEQVRTLQQQILASKPSDNFLIDRDEDYFDTECQQLCQRVQQWVLRFSKLSDLKSCRLMGDINDEKILDRLDNAILDGSDVDNFLADRVKRRDVFMSIVMTMIWDYVFTRYLFGMDREQRQKLKSLEKTLAEVGPMTAVHKWRATTLTLLSKRDAFVAQRSQDTEAVVQEIYHTLSMFLPPPPHLGNQIQESLRNVMRTAIDLSIEMRTQRAEYVMLPPLQPEYNTNGDLARQVYFNASLMNERSGDTSSNEELEAQRAVVRMVLFPLVVKKDDASGIGEQIVVCPAQVLVAKPGKDKKVVRVVSGDRMDVERAGNRSVQSFAPSSMDMGMGNMI